jgi:hypothetical protein
MREEDQMGYRNPIVARLFEVMMAIRNRFILGQDKKVVVTQTPADSSSAREDRLIGADRAIVKFRRQLAILLKRSEVQS